MASDGVGIINLDDATFATSIAKGVVLIDFFADWCGPCRALTPVLEAVAKNFTSRVQFAKVNIEKWGQVTKEYGVACVPTLILFKDGEEAGRLVGIQDEDAITKLIEGVL